MVNTWSRKFSTKNFCFIASLFILFSSYRSVFSSLFFSSMVSKFSFSVPFSTVSGEEFSWRGANLAWTLLPVTKISASNNRQLTQTILFDHKLIYFWTYLSSNKHNAWFHWNFHKHSKLKLRFWFIFIVIKRSKKSKFQVLFLTTLDKSNDIK